MDSKYRHTKIIFTIGPSTESEEMLRQLIEAKVDICRINMAHASPEHARTTIQRVRKVCAEVGREIAIMMDVKGPEIRTGNIDGTWELEANETFDLYCTPRAEESKDKRIRGVSVNYQGLYNDLKEGDTVLIDSGLIHFEVTEKLDNGTIRCKVIIPGQIKSKRHINLPGVKVNLPPLTSKDIEDLQVAIEEQIEFIALSFVRESSDIVTLRNHLQRYNSKAHILAKIEDQSAIANLDSIIMTADGLMVARGDLGIECPFEQLPIIQKNAIKRCTNLGKPVIVATHMLESMITNPVPTRAEVSDISNAVWEMADSIMLSGETTTGKYPLKCVEVMKRISHQIEATAGISQNTEFKLSSPKNKMLRSAVVLAQELDNTGIVVFTRSGRSAQLISSLRPTKCPLDDFTDDPIPCRPMRLLWGIEPFLIKFEEDHDKTIDFAHSLLKQQKLIQSNDYLIILTNILVNKEHIDTIQLRKVK